MSERQPNVKRHDPRFRAGAEQNQRQDHCRHPRRMIRGTDCAEAVGAVEPREQPESQQQSQRAEARHDEINVSRTDIFAVLVVRHDQRPGTERHELPRRKESEGIVRQHHQVHAGKEGRIEGQNPVRRFFVASVAEPIQAGRRAAEVDDDEKERRKRVQTEMRAQPRQPDRKRQAGSGAAIHDEMHASGEQGDDARRQAGAIGRPMKAGQASENHRQDTSAKKCCDTPQHHGDRHRPHPVTPPAPAYRRRRPGADRLSPAEPAIGRRARLPDWPRRRRSARSRRIPSPAINFIRESTFPRITPSLASMRWMVGTERPESSASWRWSTPSRARAARN